MFLLVWTQHHLIEIANGEYTTSSREKDEHFWSFTNFFSLCSFRPPHSLLTVYAFYSHSKYIRIHKGKLCISNIWKNCLKLAKMRKNDNVKQKIIEISFKETLSSNGMLHKKSIAEKRSYAKIKYAKQVLQQRRCLKEAEGDWERKRISKKNEIVAELKFCALFICLILLPFSRIPVAVCFWGKKKLSFFVYIIQIGIYPSSMYVLDT